MRCDSKSRERVACQAGFETGEISKLSGIKRLHGYWLNVGRTTCIFGIMRFQACWICECDTHGQHNKIYEYSDEYIDGWEE